MKEYKKIILLLISIIFLSVLTAGGCSRPLLIPGAMNRIAIWEEDNLVKIYSSIKVYGSMDDEVHTVSGKIMTDGNIGLAGSSLDQEDYLDIEGSKVEFKTYLDKDHYFKGIELDITGQDYIEFDIKYDGYYVDELISLGSFSNHPAEKVFRIDKDYLSDIKDVPFYRKNPSAELISRFISDRIFALTYFTILIILAAGTVIAGINIRRYSK